MNEQLVPQGASVVRPQPSEDYNKYIQELETLIKRVDLFLQGQEEVRDKNGNIQIVQKEQPRINERGRRVVMSWVQRYVNPNVYLAENKEHNVKANYKIDTRNIADELYKNLPEYELTIENAGALLDLVCQVMWHALQRSITDKKYIFPTISTSYGQQGGVPQENKGLMSKIFG